MTSTLRTVAVAAASAALLFTLAACSSPAPDQTSDPTSSPSASSETSVAVAAACEGDDGVTVVVDASALGDADDVSGTWCVSADDAITAAEAFTAAGVATEGTDEYGDQVVCRVNGVPAEDQSRSLPKTARSTSRSASRCRPRSPTGRLFVKPAGGEWDYATEGCVDARARARRRRRPALHPERRTGRADILT